MAGKGPDYNACFVAGFFSVATMGKPSLDPNKLKGRRSEAFKLGAKAGERASSGQGAASRALEKQFTNLSR